MLKNRVYVAGKIFWGFNLLLFAFILTSADMETAQAAAPERHLVSTIGTLGGDSSAFSSLNDSGQVVGYSGRLDLNVRGIIWNSMRPTQPLQELGTVNGLPNSTAEDINNKGQVVGYSFSPVAFTAYFWDPATGMRALPSLSGDNGTFAGALNEQGQVVGYSERLSPARVTPVIWSPTGAVSALPTLGGTFGFAWDINNNGQVVGDSETAAGFPHAFIWDPVGGMRDLGTLGGVDSYAFGISDAGHVVGESERTPNVFHAFIWDAAGGMRDLGTLGGTNSTALDVQVIGGVVQVVGTSQGPDGLYRAFIWDASRGMRPLDVPSGGSENDSFIMRINRLGQIASETRMGSGLFRFLGTIWEWDDDGDGLLDFWEKNGIDWDGNGTIDVDLPAMGADRFHKDIFVEIDYFTAPAHSHKPNPAALQLVIDTFNNAPVSNPDLTTGIHLHLDAGPDSVMNPVTGALWGTRSRSTALTEVALLGTAAGDVYNWAAFNALKAANFRDANNNPSRQETFRYGIFAHDLGGLGTAGGYADVNGSDLIVSLGSWTGAVGSLREQAGTLMHQLGHNLGLRHGGNVAVGSKPNYLSVMSHPFQVEGLIFGGLTGRFDYSRFNPPGLNESSLNEAVGLSGGAALDSYGTVWYCPNGFKSKTDAVNGPVNWNCGGLATENLVRADLNKDAVETVLASHNDWANLIYTGGAIGVGSDPQQPIVSPGHELTLGEAQQLAINPDLVMNQVSGPTSAIPGSNFIVSDTVFNQVTQVAHASTFDVGFYLSTDATITTSDTFLGSRRVAGLNPQQSSSGSTTVTVPVNQPGATYFLGAIANYNKLASTTLESNMTNNALVGNSITIGSGLSTPTNLLATAVGGGQINLTWSSSGAGTHHFEVERRVNGGAFALIGSPTPASFSDNLVNPGVAYFYRVRAVDAGGGKSAYSNIDLGTVFTDSVILVRSAVKAVHIIELRQVVDGLRAAAGLSVIIWTDPNLLPPAPAVKPFIKTIHLQQLRSNLDPALNALGFPLPVYSAISSPVKKIYLEELRNAVK